MRKTCILMVSIAVAMGITACQNKVTEWKDGLVYVGTGENRKVGIGIAGQIYLEPIYDNMIGYDDGDDKAHMADIDFWEAVKGDETTFFTQRGEPLCGGARLTQKPDYNHYGGGGIPGAFVKAYTVNGVYGIFHSKKWSEYWEFGPYEDFFPGVGGFAFKENGKWGFSTYGTLTEVTYGPNTGYHKFNRDPHTFAAPQFEKFVTIDKASRPQRQDYGWDNENEIIWYGLADGKLSMQWARVSLFLKQI